MRDMTTRQWLLIAKMQEVLGIKFKGSTMDEASKFISNHMKDYLSAKEHKNDVFQKRQ